MPTRLVNVVVDAADGSALGLFWSELLGWPIAVDTPDDVDVRCPDVGELIFDLVFAPVTDAKVVNNLVHADLASNSAEHQRALVRRALDAGATPVDIGQGDVPWAVLQDPEGAEFCVLEPREIYAGTGALASFVLDAGGPGGVRRVLVRRHRLADPPRGTAVRRAAPAPRPAAGDQPRPGVEDGQEPGALDVLPEPGEPRQDAVDALVARGARPADVEQRDVPWVVLQDPEGAEFCVLTPR
jgi:hypothetical protein